MEKGKPSYPLVEVKRLVNAGKMRMTATARINAMELGFDKGAVAQVLLSLEMREFYKSMTTYANYRIWQDVYHHVSSGGCLYIKFSIIEDVLVVSFKEK